MNRRVVVSGLGIVSPFGLGRQRFTEAIFRGESAARPITHFDPSCLSTRFAARAPLENGDLDPRVQNQKSLKTLNRAGKFAVIAADEAVRDAGLDCQALNPYRFGASLGAGSAGVDDAEDFQQRLEIVAKAASACAPAAITAETYLSVLKANLNPLSPLKGLANIPTAHIAINHNARGHCQTVSTACTSSAQAIGDAYRLIQGGKADVMLAGGSDSMVNPNGMLAFGMVGVMSKNNPEYATAARPFDLRRDGFMVGEGGAVVVLEEWEHCQRRHAEAYAEIVGYAATCDAFRLTDEPPDAWGSIEAMRQCLADAGLNPADIDYINAHGTGTRMNDRTEAHAICRVFHGTGRVPPVSSTKSMIGHLVAAAGAAEFLTCVLAVEQGLMPPTINYVQPDPECPLDCVPNLARERKLQAVLSNSFGFGGQNACLALKSI